MSQQLLTSIGAAPIDHVADANARLSIDPTGKTAGYRVIQDDGPTTYEFQGAGADTDAGLWVTGAGTTEWNQAYFWNDGSTRYEGVLDGAKRVDSGPTWSMSGDYAILTTQTYPWLSVWTVVAGSVPAPTVARNPIASEANWTIIP